MFYVYAIKNDTTGKIYIGQTANLEERLKRHNGLLKNKAKSFTNKQGAGGIWTLAYHETHALRSEAMQREKELKSYQGREFIKRKISSQ